MDRNDLVTVSLSGPLTLDRTTDLRGILLRCLAECPSAVVVDLTGATVASDLPLTVFPAVARPPSRGPRAPVPLAGPPRPRPPPPAPPAPRPDPPGLPPP